MEDWKRETDLFLEAILILFDQRAQIFLYNGVFKECFWSIVFDYLKCYQFFFYIYIVCLILLYIWCLNFR